MTGGAKVAAAIILLPVLAVATISASIVTSILGRI